MCASCGCGKLDEDHGDDRNLTREDLQDAADAAGISVNEVTKNLQAASGQGQSGTNGQAQAAASREQEVPGAQR